MYHGIQGRHYRHLDKKKKQMLILFLTDAFGFIHSLINIKLGTNYKFCRINIIILNWKILVDLLKESKQMLILFLTDAFSFT